MRAPRVVAKGSLLVAERIAELARDNGVPVLRAPPLARALFAHAEVGREIPGALYNAVAEVLAWVYQLRRFEAGDGERPAEPARCPSRLSSIPAAARRRNDQPQRRRGARTQRNANDWVSVAAMQTVRLRNSAGVCSERIGCSVFLCASLRLRAFALRYCCRWLKRKQPRSHGRRCARWPRRCSSS